MAHFYLTDALAGRTAGDTLVLGGSEGHHAASVSRIRVGEHLLIGDGNGTVADVHVTLASKGELTLLINEVEQRERPSHRFTLVQALAKTDRDERAVEATTELGIDVVIPWQAERSVSRWDASKALKGQAKWSTIAREACKQCIRPFVPTVRDVVTSPQLMAALSGQLVLVLDPTGDEKLSEVDLSRATNIALVVGPEGGISEKELHSFRVAGAHLVSAGTNILRTSTAGTAALSVVMSRLGYL